MIEQLNFEGKNKVEIAIDRLIEFEPPEGYYVAISEGKDSMLEKRKEKGLETTWKTGEEVFQWWINL
ncbi:hypothetical protein [uncultured Clostridium sp.]|uniref:hypothetical protein n=1 Tax=uncultured Clostridium sp. TaxID=59620 RepID=UPI0028E37924|nr:hypothetical protein [uncultured Clostridium sp.]